MEQLQFRVLCDVADAKVLNTSTLIDIAHVFAHPYNGTRTMGYFIIVSTALDGFSFADGVPQ